jgi:F0F1-type ATP synthase assembly protein I
MITFIMNKQSQPPFLKYSSLGVQLLATIGVAAWLGLKLDAFLQLNFPVFLLLFVFVSFGGMIYKIHRSLNE